MTNDQIIKMTDRERSLMVHQTLPDYDMYKYNAGQRSAISGADGCLERADARGEVAAWYDGYMDAATGREKWHTPLCPAHYNGDGGCNKC
jgi:hypothetical protein